MMSIKKSVYFFLFSLLLFSCANPVTPTGGAKDAIPPKVRNTNPPNLSKQIKPTKINIELNEYFTLDNPNQNISISPPIDQALKFFIKGKNLVVELPEGSLQDSTTYTLNFGTAIKDNNEGNVQDSFKFVFSTGSFLDSSSLSGNVKDAYSQAALEGFLLGLYPFPIDSLSEKPIYYTKTDKGGSFRLDNLKQGKYEVVAFKDDNASLTKDLPTEYLAFLNEAVFINDSTLPISLLSFQEKQAIQLLEYDTKQAGFIQLVYNQPIKNVRFYPINDSNTFPLLDTFLYYNATKDTLRLYYGAVATNNTIMLINTNSKLSDTIKVSIKHAEKDSIKKYSPTINLLNNLANTAKRGMAKISSNTITSIINLGKVDYLQPISITLNKPITNINLAKMLLIEDTIQLMDVLKLDSTSPMRVVFHVKQGANWKPDKQYKIMLNDSCFKDYLGNYNKPMQLSFATTKLEDYGSITIKIDSLKTDKQYIMQFLNEKKQILQKEVVSNKTTSQFTYKRLLPGKYYVSLIIDETKTKSGIPEVTF